MCNFPCKKFKTFTKRWEKYGQNFIENQNLLKKLGEHAFLAYFNLKQSGNNKEITQKTDNSVIAIQERWQKVSFNTWIGC
ncbi:Uncharacterised protein [Porphyromonas macacae]|uniref:Uncharacterized protein n=1 Tax=Porphyromonas macacae TaxID=28115 RepID=A0A379EC91_9PORP|nr:Uncharacterised protein [Porphyromonas macacae]